MSATGLHCQGKEQPRLNRGLLKTPDCSVQKLEYWRTTWVYWGMAGASLMRLWYRERASTWSQVIQSGTKYSRLTAMDKECKFYSDGARLTLVSNATSLWNRVGYEHCDKSRRCQLVRQSGEIGMRQCHYFECYHLVWQVTELKMLQCKKCLVYKLHCDSLTTYIITSSCDSLVSWACDNATPQQYLVTKHCQIEVQKEYFWTLFSNHRENS